MRVTNKIHIDLLKRTLPAEIDAVQGDAYARYAEIALYTGRIPWNVPENAVAAVRYRKPDGTRGYYDTMPDGSIAWQIRDNTITIQFAPQMLAVKGDVQVQVEIIQEASMLTTFSLVIHVQENLAAGFLKSENYINWLQWMEAGITAHIQEAFESGLFQGDPGPTGPGAALTGHTISYQASDSGTTVPSGEWDNEVPAVTQGSYLWTRIIMTFNSGDPVVSYSVSRMGADGAGRVSSVSGVLPDVDGNIPLTSADINALPLSGGTMTGAIHMNGHQLSGLKAPTADSEAATKAYADNLANSRMVRNLLDNSDFANPVNQRGSTRLVANGSAYQHFLDRWLHVDFSGASVTFTLTDEGVAVANGTGYFYQRYEKGHLKENIAYTLAIYYADGTLEVRQKAYPALVVSTANENYDQLYFTIAAGKTVLKVALYEGIYSAETLPPYMPKGYAVELAQAQRYFQTFRTESLRPAYCADFRPVMRMTTTGLPTRSTMTVTDPVSGDITYYIASAEL